MYDFKFLGHFLYEPPARSDFDRFFLDVQWSITSYHQHNTLTTKLYREEFANAKRALEAEFNKRKTEANEIYGRVFSEMEGTEQDRHSIAWHESGMQYHEDCYQQQDEDLLSRSYSLRNYFHSSSLVLFYALLEAELRGLSALVQREFGKRLSAGRFSSSDYLKGVRDYLDFIIELPMSTLEPYFTKFQEVQFLRNRFVHHGGRLQGDNEKIKQAKAIVEKNDKQLQLETQADDSQLIVITKITYVENYYELCQAFFHDCLWVIDAKLGFKYLKARLLYLFGFLAEQLSLDLVEVATISKGRRIVLRLQSTNPENIFYYRAILTLVRSQENTIDLQDQTAGSDLMRRLLSQLTTDILLQNVFAGYVLPQEHFSIGLTIWEE